MKKINQLFAGAMGVALGILAVSDKNAAYGFGTAPIEPESAFPDLYEAVMRVLVMVPMSLVLVAASLALLLNKIAKGYWEKSHDLRILGVSSLAVILSALTVFPYISESSAISEDIQLAILLFYASVSFLICARMLVLSLGYIGRKVVKNMGKK